MKTYNYSFSIYKPYGNLSLMNRGTPTEYKLGTYVFDKGIVEIYAEKKFAQFKFIHNGTLYQQSISEIEQPLSDRQLIIRAGKFARGILSTLTNN